MKMLKFFVNWINRQIVESRHIKARVNYSYKNSALARGSFLYRQTTAAEHSNFLC